MEQNNWIQDHQMRHWLPGRVSTISNKSQTIRNYKNNHDIYRCKDHTYKQGNLNKRESEPKGQSKMDNPETMATQTRHKKKTNKQTNKKHTHTEN